MLQVERVRIVLIPKNSKVCARAISGQPRDAEGARTRDDAVLANESRDEVRRGHIIVKIE